MVLCLIPPTKFPSCLRGFVPSTGLHNHVLWGGGKYQDPGDSAWLGRECQRISPWLGGYCPKSPLTRNLIQFIVTAFRCFTEKQSLASKTNNMDQAHITKTLTVLMARVQEKGR